MSSRRTAALLKGLLLIFPFSPIGVKTKPLFDGQLDAFLIADTSTLRFLDANPSICSILGYTKKELLRMSVTDIHPAKSADAIRDAFTSTLHLKTPATELVQFLRKDGSIFSGLITAFTIQYSGRLCLIGFVRENSQRHSKWATPAEVFKTFVSQSAYGFVDFDV